MISDDQAIAVIEHLNQLADKIVAAYQPLITKW